MCADHLAPAARPDPQGPNTISYEPSSCAKPVMDLMSLATAQANTEEKLAGLLCCLPQAMVPADLAMPTAPGRDPAVSSIAIISIWAR